MPVRDKLFFRFTNHIVGTTILFSSVWITARKNIKTVQTFVWMISTASMSVMLSYQAVWINVLVKPGAPLDAKVIRS